MVSVNQQHFQVQPAQPTININMVVQNQNHSNQQQAALQQQSIHAGGLPHQREMRPGSNMMGGGMQMHDPSAAASCSSSSSSSGGFAPNSAFPGSASAGNLNQLALANVAKAAMGPPAPKVGEPPSLHAGGAGGAPVSGAKEDELRSAHNPDGVPGFTAENPDPRTLVPKLEPCNKLTKLKIKSFFEGMRAALSTTQKKSEEKLTIFQAKLDCYHKSGFVRLENLLERDAKSGRTIFQEVCIRGEMEIYDALQQKLPKDIFRSLHEDRTAAGLNCLFLVLLSPEKPRRVEFFQSCATILKHVAFFHDFADVGKEKSGEGFGCVEANFGFKTDLSVKGKMNIAQVLALKQEEGNIGLLEANWIKDVCDKRAKTVEEKKM
eukprot:g7017.t1